MPVCEQKRVESDNLSVCSPVNVYACVCLSMCEGGVHTSMGKSALFPTSPRCLHAQICVCVSVSCVDQSKVTVLADA